MNKEIKFLKMVKNNEFYCIETDGYLDYILYKDNRLSNSTFVGWFPVSCFVIKEQIFLIKCTLKKEWVIWELNLKYEYIRHNHMPQKLFCDDEIISFFGDILNPLDVINEENINVHYKEILFLNSLNLETIIPSWIKSINMDASDCYVQLLEANINIKNICIFFESVSSSFLENTREINKNIPPYYKIFSKNILYQENALINSEFNISDIFGGEDILVNRSIVLTSQKIAFFCKSKKFSYYIFSSDELGTFTHIYIPKLNLVINKFNNHKENIELESKNNIKLLLSRILKIKGFTSSFIGKNKKNSCLITGVNCKSMYHLLVNDLAGLGRLKKYSSKKHNFNVATTKAISLLGLDNKFIKKVFVSFYNKIYDLDNSLVIDELNNKHFCTFLRSNFNVNEEIRRMIVNSIIEQATPTPLVKNWSNKKIVIIGIRGGRRRWLNQAEGIAFLINKINNTVPNILFIFDGTGSIEFDSNSEEYIDIEEKIVKSILDKLENVDSISLIGKPIFLSIYAALKSLFYISPWGAGLTKYQILADKTGVVHTNNAVIESFTKRYYFWERFYMPKIYYSKPLDSIDFKEDNVDTPKDNRPDWKLFYNYHVDEKNVFRLVKKLLVEKIGV